MRDRAHDLPHLFCFNQTRFERAGRNWWGCEKVARFAVFVGDADIRDRNYLTCPSVGGKGKDKRPNSC